MMAENKYKVAIVEDDKSYQPIIESYLSEASDMLQCSFYIDGKQFLGGSEKFDLVILDIDGITISNEYIDITTDRGRGYGNLYYCFKPY